MNTNSNFKGGTNNGGRSKFRHCTNDYNDKFSVWDIKQKSLKSFWLSETRTSIMEKMKKGDWDNIMLCKGCSAPYTVLNRKRLYETNGEKIVLGKALHDHLYAAGTRHAKRE